MFLQHPGDGLGGAEGRIALAAALGGSDKRLLELIGEAEVAHCQTAGLVAKDAVHSADGSSGKPSSFRNALCLLVAVLIAFSIFSNAAFVASRLISSSPTAVLM